MNPLDTGDEFTIELMNPNPTSSKTKAGPVYRVSFEMHREDWECFMDANTNGMILYMTGKAVEIPVTSFSKSERPKGGPISKEAAMLCQDDLANDYARSMGFDDFKHMTYIKCGVESRATLDHSRHAETAWQWLKSDFIRYAEERDDSYRDLI